MASLSEPDYWHRHGHFRTWPLLQMREISILIVRIGQSLIAIIQHFWFILPYRARGELEVVSGRAG